VAHSAHAQINLPLNVPRVPDVTSTLGVNRAAPGLENTLEATLRQVRVRDLLRLHRDVLERDPRGEAVVRGELLGVGVSAEAIERAKAAGFQVLRTTPLQGLDVNIVAFKPPSGRSVVQALKQLRDIDPAGSYDFNHIYVPSGEVGSNTAAPNMDAHETSTTRIGLIDGGIDHLHPALRDANIIVWGCENRAIPNPHGTAIASLMIGDSAAFHGVAPHSTLFAADVYCDSPTGGAVETIAAAFAWLASNRIGVINVSLVGPSNIMLQQVVRAMNERGHLIVAAVGNDGPNAPPLYPAAYPGVVAVTGVDRKRRVLIEAVHGTQVMFSAPGANMLAASTSGAYAQVRGTSFASPIVATVLALRLQQPDRATAQAAVASLQGEAIDLGAPGRDDTYGFGLVGENYRVEK
jgi:subtilisin family serine protease